MKCWGTSLFLKNRYGVGYTLAMSKRPKCDEERVNSLVLDGIKGATKMTNVATEISFRLPVRSFATKLCLRHVSAGMLYVCL